MSGSGSDSRGRAPAAPVAFDSEGFGCEREADEGARVGDEHADGRQAPVGAPAPPVPSAPCVGVGGRGVAITGLVLGYVGLGILALYLAIFLFVGIVFGFANIF